MLEKPEYDCNNLDDYDCGCGDEDEEETGASDEEQTLLKVTKKADADSNPAVEITKEP